MFNVKKRDYEWGFGHLDYENVTLTSNFYYRNYGLIPFDMKFSAGEYLAGDVGYTIELSRSFYNGVQFGVFATFTDVTAEQFGEGSFDKGVFFLFISFAFLIPFKESFIIFFIKSSLFPIFCWSNTNRGLSKSGFIDLSSSKNNST